MDYSLVEQVAKVLQIGREPCEEAEIVSVVYDFEPMTGKKSSEGVLVVAGPDMVLRTGEVMDGLDSTKFEEARKPIPVYGTVITALPSFESTRASSCTAASSFSRCSMTSLQRMNRNTPALNGSATAITSTPPM